MQTPSRAKHCVPAIAIAAMTLTFGPAIASGQSSAGFVPVTDAMLHDPAPGDWLTWRRTLDSWGYSPLDEINVDNVGALRMVWSRGLTDGYQSGTPLAYNGVLYMPNPNDVIQALDAVTGDLIWEHRRNVPDDVGEYLLGALATNNRNIAIYGRLIIDTTVDDHIHALDAVTGEMAWETQVLDYRVNPATQGAGPIVAGGKVVSGRSCQPRGGPEACVVVAHDAVTGAELWERPSGHDVAKAFGKENSGAIPSNLLQIPNTESNSAYLRLCKMLGRDSHPARFPSALPQFFIKFLTDPGDVVVDIFSGSNTTGQAAEQLGRRWLSMELDREYAALSAVRFMGQWSDDDVHRTIARLDAGEVVEIDDASLPIDVERTTSSVRKAGVLFPR